MTACEHKNGRAVRPNSMELRANQRAKDLRFPSIPYPARILNGVGTPFRSREENDAGANTTRRPGTRPCPPLFLPEPTPEFGVASLEAIRMRAGYRWRNGNDILERERCSRTHCRLPSSDLDRLFCCSQDKVEAR